MNAYTTMSLLENKRLMWIDWMKAMGIYFIVAGHFFSVGHLFIYSFSVPLFFWVSGFLSKREESNKLFWRKIFFNMVLPMLIISFINSVIDNVFLTRDIHKLLLFPLYFILGFHDALKCLWFVYTLICLRIILQYTPQNKFADISLLIILPCLGIWIDAHPLFWGYDVVSQSNAIIDTTTAYPFFIIGFYSRQLRNFFIKFNNLLIQTGVLIISCAVILIGSRLNGYVWMYINGYGNNFLLFIIDGLFGTLAIFIISKWMDNRCAHSIITISKGTIIILGFHYYLIDFVNSILPANYGVDYIYALLIIIFFIPVIRFSERHLPYMVGKYRV